MEHVDVIVVGARCAGSPLAALLARRGVRVAAGTALDAGATDVQDSAVPMTIGED